MSDERMIRVDNLKLLMTQLSLSKADVARQLKTSDTYVSKLLSGRPGTFGEKAARRVEEKFGKPRFWLDAIHRDGAYTSESLKESGHSDPALQYEAEAATRSGNAHFVTEAFTDNLLPVITWEQLEMLEKENTEFKGDGDVYAPADGFSGKNSKWIKMASSDDSMAEKFPPSTMLRVELVSDGALPAPGKFVIVSDKHGGFTVRRYKLVSRDHFLAEPLNQGYAILDSERDELKVVAVVRQALINM